MKFLSRSLYSECMEKGHCYLVKSDGDCYLGRILKLSDETYVIDAVYAYEVQGEKIAGFGDCELKFSETTAIKEVPADVSDKLYNGYKDAYETVMRLKPKEHLQPYKFEIGCCHLSDYTSLQVVNFSRITDIRNNIVYLHTLFVEGTNLSYVNEEMDLDELKDWEVTRMDPNVFGKIERIIKFQYSAIDATMRAYLEQIE